ncbi:hypothetical protein ACFVAJ_00490 [Agromyces sp. NPDC057679]|uniref:hypothetical protein n=1 Tax=Agromyces sp. NPDC057679 TaxID=3346207 RepID=UPI00366E8D5C
MTREVATMSAEPRTVDRTGYPPPALTVAVLAVIAVALAVLAALALGDTAARASASYTPLEATVVDERIEEQTFAVRTGSRTATFRVVSVELPDGARADVRSDDLAVGASATVYLSATGAVFEHPPEPPGAFEWTLCAAAVAAAVVLAGLAVRSALRLRSRPRRPS